MSLEENKAVVRRWFSEVMSNGDISTVDLICMECHPGFAVLNGVMENPPTGIPGVKEMVRLFRSAFPDLQFDVEDQIAEGNKVATQLKVHGTHQGDFLGIPPTGKQITTWGISIWELADGKLLQEHVSWDTLGLLQQLGAIPSGPPA